jgi:hypothetical protein
MTFIRNPRSRTAFIRSLFRASWWHLTAGPIAASRAPLAGGQQIYRPKLWAPKSSTDGTEIAFGCCNGNLRTGIRPTGTHSFRMKRPEKEPIMDRLPVYRLDRPLTSAGDLLSAAARVFDITDGFAITESPGRLSLHRRNYVVEQHSASGGIWAADQSAGSTRRRPQSCPAMTRLCPSPRR